MKTKLAISTLSLAFVALTSLAPADVINIQFQGQRKDPDEGLATLYTGQGALTTPDTKPVWNGLALPNFNNENGSGTGGGTFNNLVDSSGIGTSVGIIVPDTYSQNLYPNAQSSSTPFGSSTNTLLESYLFVNTASALKDPGQATSPGSATFTLTGLGTGDFNLYLYSTNGNGGNGGLFTVNGNLLDPQSTSGDNNAGFVEGAQYVEFTNIASVNGDITITLNAQASGEGDFNGLQLQSIVAPVPEPSTVAMSLAGLIALGLVARHRSSRQA